MCVAVGFFFCLPAEFRSCRFRFGRASVGQFFFFFFLVVTELSISKQITKKTRLLRTHFISIVCCLLRHSEILNFFSQFSPNYNLRNSFTFVDCWALFCNISLVSCWKFTERLDFDLQSFNVISLGNYLKKKDLAVHFFRFDNRIVTRNASLLFFFLKKKKKTRFIHFPPVDTPSPSVLIIFLLFSMFFFLGRFSIVFRALLYGASISIIFLSVLCRSFYFDPTGPLAGPTTST